MFCPQCGAKVNENANFCPSCGTKLTNIGTNTTTPSQTPSPAPAQKRRMPLWFKILATLAVLALLGVTTGILFTEKLVDVIDNQLDVLRQGDIDKAYRSYTSKDFQEATSLDQFRHFIKAYPILQHNQAAHFDQRTIKDHVAILKGNLISDEHRNVPIEYRLAKEEGKWKILSIRLLQPNSLQPPTERLDPEELLNLVKSQLKDLEHQDLKKAYEDYSSQEFKEATSFADFQKFVKKYPILTHHDHASFQNPNEKNGISIIAAILKSEQTAAYLKYYLVYENNQWKIWSLRILSPSEEEANEQAASPQSSSDHMELASIKLGNQIDQNGVIEHPTAHFKTDAGNIYVNVEINHGTKGSVVSLNFQHLDTSSFIPAKATIEENGDSILMSVFSPPADGWPKGQYKLVVTSSDGLNKVVDFDIE